MKKRNGYSSRRRTSSSPPEARPKVVGILQARMGSTRLPGKVLMRLAGKTVLGHCIDRMHQSQVLDEIVVATTALAGDDMVAREALRNRVRCFRGPEDDVLTRYVRAAAEAEAKVVVRVTADNPLTCPASMRRIVTEILENGWDYVAEVGLPCGAASEAVTIQALRRIDRLASDPSHREHVTLFLKENPGRFKARWLDCDPSRTAPEMRVTIDTPDDLQFLRAMARKRVLRLCDFSVADFIRRLRDVALRDGSESSDKKGEGLRVGTSPAGQEELR